jgi:hypothetical protein
MWYEIIGKHVLVGMTYYGSPPMGGIGVRAPPVCLGGVWRIFPQTRHQ